MAQTRLPEVTAAPDCERSRGIARVLLDLPAGVAEEEIGLGYPVGERRAG